MAEENKNEEVMEEILEELEEDSKVKAEQEAPDTASEAAAAQEEDAAESAEAEEAAAEDSKAEEKKSFFKKKPDKKDEQIEKLTAELSELKDKDLRRQAEFDNFRKRTEVEKTQRYDMGAKTVIEKLLPVIDNFERGLATVPAEEAESPFVDGMNKIYKQIIAMFDEIGVKPIEAVGAEFDPNLHNAVMHVEDDTLGENVVAEDLQKGYLYKDSVVRHSMVKVAN